MAEEFKPKESSQAITTSEALFEDYLTANGHQFDYEPDIPDTEKHPDYRVVIDEQEVLFDVKQFDPPDEASTSFGNYDPYAGTREKINEVREQFRGLKKYPCVLVLFNAGWSLVELDAWAVYASMLGDVQWSIPLDPGKGLREEETRLGFGSRGKMVWYAKGGVPLKAVNTTISAIVVLGSVPHGMRRLMIADRLKGEPETWEEMLASMEAAKGTDRDPEISTRRVVVHDNPFAATPLPKGFGRGPFDERYGPDGKRIRRLFVGDDLGRLEEEERAAGIEVHDPFGFKR